MRKSTKRTFSDASIPIAKFSKQEVPREVKKLLTGREKYMDQFQAIQINPDLLSAALTVFKMENRECSTLTLLRFGETVEFCFKCCAATANCTQDIFTLMYLTETAMSRLYSCGVQYATHAFTAHFMPPLVFRMLWHQRQILSLGLAYSDGIDTKPALAALSADPDILSDRTRAAVVRALFGNAAVRVLTLRRSSKPGRYHFVPRISNIPLEVGASDELVTHQLHFANDIGDMLQNFLSSHAYPDGISFDFGPKKIVMQMYPNRKCSASQFRGAKTAGELTETQKEAASKAIAMFIRLQAREFARTVSIQRPSPQCMRMECSELDITQA